MQQQKSEDYSGPTRTEGQFPLVDLQLSVTCVTNRVRQIINHSRIMVHRYRTSPGPSISLVYSISVLSVTKRCHPSYCGGKNVNSLTITVTVIVNNFHSSLTVTVARSISLFFCEHLVPKKLVKFQRGPL